MSLLSFLPVLALPGAAALLLSPAGSFANSMAGCELTLTRGSLVSAVRYTADGSQISSNSHSAELRARLFEKIRETCTECSFETIPSTFREANKHKVTYPDGWWFLISYDPGVIEIQCEPFESSFHDEFIRRMNRDLFQPAASKPLFLKPEADIGMGHVNLDFSTTFGGDVRLLKDFLADLLNHSAIGTGIVGQGQ